MLTDPNQPYNLCGFSFQELVDLRADLVEAFVFNNWTDKYEGEQRIKLRKCLGLSDT